MPARTFRALGGAAVPLTALLLLAACAQVSSARAPAVSPVAAALAANDTNVYSFRRQGPDGAGTAAVTARPTAGPDAAPTGTIADADGRARAEAAVAFYAQNTICNGAAFQPMAGTSRYDAAENSWTVFGRCAGA